MTPTVAPSRTELAELATVFEDQQPQEILAWAIALYGTRLTIASSFGGPSSMVILDMAMRLDASISVHYLDTGLLFEETYATVGAVGAYYGITPIAVRPKLSVEAQAVSHGDQLWGVDPDSCCRMRKVEPQREFLRNYDAWITGLRRDQASTRRATPVVQWDEQFHLVKINPLARWSQEQTTAYVRAHELPLNPLLERGYPSVGCRPCTRATGPAEDARAGRWSGFQKLECGLHQTPTSQREIT